jgi:acetyltransferase-like isoleucine patch superfamily enzyme
MVRLRSFGYLDIEGRPFKRGLNGIVVGKNLRIGHGSFIGCWTQEACINIGDNVGIGSYAHITAINRIDIQSGVLLGKNVTISDNSHGNLQEEEKSIPPANRQLHSKGPIFIGSNVWIGDKATILANVRIGNGTVIGANSVVTKDLPSNCIAAGIPAKIIRYV